jgi:hypothetical protein
MEGAGGARRRRVRAGTALLAAAAAVWWWQSAAPRAASRPELAARFTGLVFVAPAPAPASGWTSRIELPAIVAEAGADRALLLVDLVLVPKHGHIMASGLGGDTFRDRVVGRSFGKWVGPGSWERLAKVCEALPALKLAVGSRELQSGPCVPLEPLDPNLVNATSFGTFSLAAEAREAIRNELAARGPRAEIAVRLTADGLYATIDPVSRAAGLFRRVRRPGAGREDEDLTRAAAWADPLGSEGANPPEQLSVCMKHIHDSNPFMEDVVAHHEAQGVAHLYLSVIGPEIEREMAERLARWIAAGFLTLVQLDGLGSYVELAGRQSRSFWGRLEAWLWPPQQLSRFWKDQVKMFFINSCLHHAKQVDALVGVWDIDELASIHEPGWTDPHLGRYIVERYASWAPAAGHTWNATSPALTRPSAPNADLVRVASALLLEGRANATAQAVMPLQWYCEVSLGRFTDHPPVSACPWSHPRNGKLARAYPFRSELPDRYPKGVAIAANVQLVELHQHNFNCERNELERAGDGELRVMRQQPPFAGAPFKQRRRSIYAPAPALFMHHFADVYG